MNSYYEVKGKINNYYYADATTKSEAYSEDSMLSYEPQYNWGEN